ncbi:RND family efflux transporter MFP subunit [Rhodovulum imhoffii]|uniref:RND family efflux transporter MFP subunit n=1 Tax=Rhodovulum imhoffii TaxID=365340 RepID=A0A2T5BSP4_9RHOB|nr:efflux RND transporter periplasmic adaptor subunit [Rhodovulum imhoffii]MBK5933051.1 hypothetical protein [Rhodovulum imhoffii]PTN02361.1 RND family efflux transporter MFP subunit [Rhodovulum imhoffii]
MIRILAWFLLLPAPALADTPARPVVSAIIEISPDTRRGYVGTVEARTKTDLGFPLIGTLAARPAEIGQRVQKGDILARLDPQDLDADQRAAQAGVSVAEAQLRSARDAETRARELAARGVGSATRLEDARRALTAAEAQLEQARATLARADYLRGLATLSAPHDGVVTAVHLEPGATVAAGQPVLSLAAQDVREVVIDVTEKDAARLPPGAVFDVALAITPGLRARARLDRTDPVAQRATRTRRLYLSLEDPPSAFRLGTLVRVLPIGSVAEGWRVPLSSVLIENGGTALWIVDRTDDTVHRRPVVLGPVFGDMVRVSSGLSAGDEVVLKGIHSLQDGQRVGPRVTE